jgi:hypothetical protein
MAKGSAYETARALIASAPNAEIRRMAVRLVLRTVRARIAFAETQGLPAGKASKGGGGVSAIPQNEYPAKDQKKQPSKLSRAKKLRLKGAPLRRPGGQPGNRNAETSGCHGAGMQALRVAVRTEIAALLAKS